MVGGQRHAPAAWPSGMTQYPLHRRLDGPQDRSGQVRKICPRTGILSPESLARSESLYRLSYRGPQNTFSDRHRDIPCKFPNTIIARGTISSAEGLCCRIIHFTWLEFNEMRHLTTSSSLSVAAVSRNVKRHFPDHKYRWFRATCCCSMLTVRRYGRGI